MFVATLGHSRRLHVRAFRHEKQESWFSGLESAFTTFGGVPEDVLMDNPRALVVRHDAVEPDGSVQRQADRICEALGLPSSGLRAVSGPHEGQDRERRRLCEEERDRGALLRELGGIRGAPRQVGARGRERAHPRHDRRGADRPLRARRGAPVEAARRAAVVWMPCAS